MLEKFTKIIIFLHDSSDNMLLKDDTLTMEGHQMKNIVGLWPQQSTGTASE
jgi:hypothetical protein